MNKKNSITKKIKNILIPALIIVGIFFYFNKKNSATALVRRVSIEDREVKRTVSSSGIVVSDKKADLSFLASGVITRIYVSENEQVKKGQLLGSVNSSVQNQTIQSYKDARDMRLRQIELFKNEKKANARMLGGNDSYNIKLREYEEALSQAEASYQAQLSLLSNYYIYAPFDGTVVKISQKEGEAATPGVPVITVADLNDIIFEVVLDQEDFSMVKEDQEVDIDLDSYKNHTFTGVVKSLSLYSDPTKGGFVVKNVFESNGKSIKVGMTGDAYMIIDKTEDAVPSLIFNEISYNEDGDPFVWVLDGKKVKKEPIELGLEGDLYSEIKSDLKDKTILVPATEDTKIEEGYVAIIIN